jgi:hypothetical protein
MAVLAAVLVAKVAKDFSVPDHLRVSQPCAVFHGLELGDLRHFDPVSPTETNDFPQVIIGREPIELDEQIPDYAIVFPDEGHAIKPLEKGSLIRVVVIQHVSGNDLKRVGHPFLLPAKPPFRNGDNWGANCLSEFRIVSAVS